jgi:hypothetical protein
MPELMGTDLTRRRDEQTREANKNPRSAIARLVIGETFRLDTSDDSRKSSQENHRLRPVGIATLRNIPLRTLLHSAAEKSIEHFCRARIPSLHSEKMAPPLSRS